VTATESLPAIGLDWLIVDLLLLSVVFIPLERAAPLDPDRPAIRRGWSADLWHFFVSHLCVQLTLLATTAPALALFRWSQGSALQETVTTLPTLAQLGLLVVVVDLSQYWAHRLFHHVPRLWRIHEVHHSSTQLDWLAASRLHFVDVIVTRALGYIPVFILGFSLEAIQLYTVFAAFHTIFIHANLRWRFRWLEPVLVTPRYHHWHHGAEQEAIDVNFAVHLPVLDRLFGTQHFPRDGSWPKRYGVMGSDVPDQYALQWMHPFRARRDVRRSS
jgi:lathosterol oxidase